MALEGGVLTARG
jgi:hypothetical protein